MTVSLEADVITLSGHCGVEEVEILVNCLEGRPGATVDIVAATSIHTALWQALLVFGPPLRGSSEQKETGTAFVAISTYIGKSR